MTANTDFILAADIGEYCDTVQSSDVQIGSGQKINHLIMEE